MVTIQQLNSYTIIKVIYLILRNLIFQEYYLSCLLMN
ncbi:hypothetical protein BMETH_2357_0 [methanotrophic bacterial endosymbiont of Bathymodiolus sp.]|nr:hypothetical protein BMETH_2357_0 [methanotrophic bacterial endosymbiont of Bathymodiolus sp.]